MLVDIDNNGRTLNVSFFNEDGVFTFKEIIIEKNSSWKTTDKKTKHKNWRGDFVKEYYTKNMSDTDLFYHLNRINFQSNFNVKPLPTFVDFYYHNNVLQSIIILTNMDKILIIGNKKYTEAAVEEVKSYIQQTYEFNTDILCMYKGTEECLLHYFVDKLLSKIHFLIYWSSVTWQKFKKTLNKHNINLSNITHNNKPLKNNIPHKFTLDYCAIFNRFDQTTKIKDVKTMEFISKKCLKIDFPKTIIFEQKISNIIFGLFSLRKFEMQNNLLEIVFNIAYSTQTPLKNILNNSKVAESALTNYFLKKDIIVTDEHYSCEKKTYKGAYTNLSKPGLYSKVVYLDFEKMYVNIMRSFNISPETFSLTKCNNNKQIQTANGTFYSDNDSAMKNILTHFIQLGQKTKDKIEKINQKIAELELKKANEENNTDFTNLLNNL